MTIKFFPKTKGFTLIEMVLYVALCSIILLSLSTMLSFLLGSRVRSQAITEVNQQGLQVMNMMTETIRNARSVETPSLGVSSSVLSVTTGTTILNPTIFDVSSSTLRIQEGGKQAIALTNSRVLVSSLTFQNVSSASSSEKVIRISFTIDHLNLPGRNEYSFTKVFTGSATLRK